MLQLLQYGVSHAIRPSAAARERGTLVASSGFVATLFADGERSEAEEDLRGVIVESCHDPSFVSVLQHRTNLSHPLFVEIGTSRSEQIRETCTCERSNFWTVIERVELVERSIKEYIARLLSKDVLESTGSGTDDRDRSKGKLPGDCVVCCKEIARSKM